MSDQTVAVGQRYDDQMFDTTVEVTHIDEIAVYVRDVDDLDAEMRGHGSPYVWELWNENVEAGRFTLSQDVDTAEQTDSPVEQSEAAEDDSEPTPDAGETETTESTAQTEQDEQNEEVEETTVENFEQQDALSW